MPARRIGAAMDATEHLEHGRGGPAHASAGSRRAYLRKRAFSAPVSRIGQAVAVRALVGEERMQDALVRGDEAVDLAHVVDAEQLERFLRGGPRRAECPSRSPTLAVGRRQDHPVARADAHDEVVVELAIERAEHGDEQLVGQLVALDPLREQAARLQVALDLLVELDGEEARHAAHPRVGRLGDDDVVLVAGPRRSRPSRRRSGCGCAGPCTRDSSPA